MRINKNGSQEVGGARRETHNRCLHRCHYQHSTSTPDPSVGCGEGATTQPGCPSLSPSRSQLRVELASALRQQEYDSKERKRLEEGKGELESKLKEVEAKLAHMSTALHAAQVSVRRSSHACVMRHPTPGPSPCLREDARFLALIAP